MHAADSPLADARFTGGDHVCLAHDSDSALTTLAERFLADGLAAGERVIVLADSAADEPLAGIVGRVGTGTRDDQLDVRSARDSYLDGGFDSDRLLARLAADKRAALAEGFTGLRLFAQMHWVATDGPGPDALRAHEEASTALCADGHATGMCEYDRRRHTSSTVAAAAAGHPLLAAPFEDVATFADKRAAVDVGGHGTVRLRGEFDLCNVQLLRRALAKATERPGDIVVDASELDFIDVRALDALVQTATTHDIALLAPQPSVRRLVDALRLPTELPHLAVAG